MLMEEEKLVIKELQQGKESTIRLMNKLKSSSSSSSSYSESEDSNKILISEILRSYENAKVILSLEKETRRRSPERMDQSHKKRKKTEKIKVCVGTRQEGTSLDDGYCWRKYGQKVINGSKSPRGYYRCTYRFTRGCLAVKQVQKSDTDPLCYEVKYLENHTCNKTLSTNNHSVSMLEEEEPKKQSKDTIKHMKSEELMLSSEDIDIKKDIFRTFSFTNPEQEYFSEWKNLSPTTSESGITNELLSASVSVVDSPRDDDSCFSSLENILVLTHDLSWL